MPTNNENTSLLDLDYAVRFLVLVSIIFFSSYLRGIDLVYGVTTTYLIIPLVVIAVLDRFITLHQNPLATFTTNSLLVWSLVGWTIVIYIINLIIYPRPITNTRFLLEFLLGPLVFFATVTMINRNHISYLYQAHLLASVVVGLLFFLYPLYTGVESIRRLGVGSTVPLSLSTNYLSSMFGIAIVIAITHILLSNKLRIQAREFSILPILFYGLVITGSRSAMIGVLTSISILIFTIGSRKTIKPLLSIGFGIVISVGLLNSFYDFTGGYRFTIDHFLYSIRRLFEIISGSLGEIIQSPLTIFFGIGFYRYEPIAPTAVTALSYPHNFLVALFAYIGLFGAVLAGGLIVLTIQQLFQSALHQSENEQYLSAVTLASLLVFLTYVMTEGRATRVFTLWVLLGIAVRVVGSHSENLNILDNEHSDI